MKLPNQETVIKVGAMLTAAPRITMSLAASEGVYVPDEWMPVWRILSFTMALGMAVVEAFAFSYCMKAWRYMRPGSPQARNMAIFIGASALVFVGLMTPTILAYIRHVEVTEVLGEGMQAIWAMFVVLSTIVIISSVGYGQSRSSNKIPSLDKLESIVESVVEKSNDSSNSPQQSLDYGKYVEMNIGRNGQGPLPAKELIAMGVKKSTAYNWYSKYVKEHENV